MRILFHIADTDGCGLHRCIIPANFLNGIEGVEANYTAQVSPELIEQHDVIIFQRSNQPHFQELFRDLRTDPNKLLVYEADDAFDLIPDDSYSKKFFPPHILKNMEALMATCDVLQLSTPYLCDHYGKKVGRPVYLVPNQVGMLREHQYHDDEKVIIGWAGGASHNVDIRLIKKALMQIEKEFPQVEFHIMGASNVFDMMKKWGMSRLKYIDWSKDINQYYNVLSTFDIGLAPVVECGFNKAKSTLKFLEYGACRTPMVGSKFLYEQDAIHDETAMLPSRPLEWYEMIKELVVNKEKRLAIGYAAQDYVASERMHQHHIYSRVDFYQRALEAKRRILTESLPQSPVG